MPEAGLEDDLLQLQEVPTQVHNVISANGTIVNNNVPRPESDSVPLRQIRIYTSTIGLL